MRVTVVIYDPPPRTDGMTFIGFYRPADYFYSRFYPRGKGNVNKILTRGMNTISWRMELAAGGRRSGAGRENDI